MSFLWHVSSILPLWSLHFKCCWGRSLSAPTKRPTCHLIGFKPTNQPSIQPLIRTWRWPRRKINGPAAVFVKVAAFAASRSLNAQPKTYSTWPIKEPPKHSFITFRHHQSLSHCVVHKSNRLSLWRWMSCHIDRISHPPSNLELLFIFSTRIIPLPQGGT